MRLALLLMTAGCALPGLALARRSDLQPLADGIQRVLYWTGIPLVVVVLSGAPVRSAGLAVGVAIACLSLTAVAARLYARRRFADHGERAAFTLSAFWPNSGWLGLPVAVAVLGSGALPSALLYSSVASGPHNFVVGGSVAAAGRPSGAKVGLLASVRHNHYLPAIALGLAWAFSGLPRSGVLSSTAGWIALATAGPAFFAFGIILANAPKRPDRDTFAALGLRLGLSPALLLATTPFVFVPRPFLLQAGMATGLSTLTMAGAHGLPSARIAPTIAWGTALVVGIATAWAAFS